MYFYLIHCCAYSDIFSEHMMICPCHKYFFPNNKHNFVLKYIAKSEI